MLEIRTPNEIFDYRVYSLKTSQEATTGLPLANYNYESL